MNSAASLTSPRRERACRHALGHTSCAAVRTSARICRPEESNSRSHQTGAFLAPSAICNPQGRASSTISSLSFPARTCSGHSPNGATEQDSTKRFQRESATRLANRKSNSKGAWANLQVEHDSIANVGYAIAAMCRRRTRCCGGWHNNRRGSEAWIYRKERLAHCSLVSLDPATSGLVARSRKKLSVENPEFFCHRFACRHHI